MSLEVTSIKVKGFWGLQIAYGRIRIRFWSETVDKPDKLKTWFYNIREKDKIYDQGFWSARSTVAALMKATETLYLDCHRLGLV